MENPPSPFENLKDIATEPDATTRAKRASEVLKAIPDLQKWLRPIRQHAVQEMHDDGLSYEQIGKELGMHRVRAHQIAEGRTSGKRADATSERPARPDEEPTT